MQQQPLDIAGKFPRRECRPDRNLLNSRELRRFLVVQSIIQRHRTGHLAQLRLRLAFGDRGSVCPCVIVDRSLKHGIRLRFRVLHRPVREILGYIYYAAAFYDRDSNHVVIRTQNIGSMRWRIHQSVVCRDHIITKADVLRLPVRREVLIGEANLQDGLSVKLVGQSLMCCQ